MASSGETPAYLPIGTQVSAKYKGAFCEARVRSVLKQVKCRVTFKSGLGTTTLSDEFIHVDDGGSSDQSSTSSGSSKRNARSNTGYDSDDKRCSGCLVVGATVKAKHPDKLQYFEATVNKIQDQSLYTVVFDDGDITTLRRNALCIKSGKHFRASESLDSLPLTHPEHFGSPVSVGGDLGVAGHSLTDSAGSQTSDDACASGGNSATGSLCPDASTPTGRRRRSHGGKVFSKMPRQAMGDDLTESKDGSGSGTGDGDNSLADDQVSTSAESVGSVMSRQASDSSSSSSDSDDGEGDCDETSSTNGGDSIDSDDSLRTNDSTLTPRRRRVKPHSRSSAHKIVFCIFNDGQFGEATPEKRQWQVKLPCLGQLWPLRLAESGTKSDLTWPETALTNPSRKRSGYKHLSLRYVDYADYVGRVIWAETGHSKRFAAGSGNSDSPIFAVPSNWFPAVVVAPSSASLSSRLNIDVRREFVIRSFRDGRYYTVGKRNASAFCQCHKLYLDDVLADQVATELTPALRRAVDGVYAYVDRDELPGHWDKDVLFSVADFSQPATGDAIAVHEVKQDIPGSGPSGEVEITTQPGQDSADLAKPDEVVKEVVIERDMLVAMLYKHMEEERGTPIHRSPAIGHCELDLYTLFSTVYGQMGGYAQVTAENKWREVGKAMRYFNTSWAANQLRIYYKRYLLSFEEVYRSIGADAVACEESAKELATSLTTQAEREVDSPRKRRISTSSNSSTDEIESTSSAPKLTPHNLGDGMKAVKRIRRRSRTQSTDLGNGSSPSASDMLTIGDEVDVQLNDRVKVYYKHTDVIYEAKVIKLRDRDLSVAKGSTNQTDGEGVVSSATTNSRRLFMVHYLGWNSRHDEWIARRDIAENMTWQTNRSKCVESQPQQLVTEAVDPVDDVPSEEAECVDFDNADAEDLDKSTGDRQPDADEVVTKDEELVEAQPCEEISNSIAVADETPQADSVEDGEEAVEEVDNEMTPTAKVETKDEQPNCEEDVQKAELASPTVEESSDLVVGPKFNFLVEFDDNTPSAERIAILQRNIEELRDTYITLKSDLAIIERRKKKMLAKRKASVMASPPQMDMAPEVAIQQTV